MARNLLIASLTLALAGAATAQEVKLEPQKPAPQKQEPEKKQEPTRIEKPPELDRIDELKAQLERTKSELAATKEMVQKGGLPGRVRPGLTGRGLNPTTLDLGVEAIPQPKIADAEPARATGVRLLGDAEKERLGPDVIMTVDGEPVTKQEFDDTFAYFSTRPNVGDENQSKRDALRALVIQKASLAHFRAKAPLAREKMAEIEHLLAGGGDFAEVAKQHSQCPSAAQGGDLGEFGRNVMDPMFEKAAFQTKVGETSGVIQSAFGYHIVKVTGHETGDNEKVHASHILVMFDDDQQAIRQAMMQAMQGQVDLAFANDDWRKLSPF